MKKNLIALFLLINFHTKAQELLNLKNPTTITTVAYWNKGETRTYHVGTNKSEYKNNVAQPSREQKTEYDLTLEVTDSTEKSYTIQMVYSNYILPAQLSDSEKELTRIAENMKIIYRTNELGDFEGIVNKKELITSMQKVWDASMKKLSARITDPQQKEKMNQRLAEIKNMLTNENNIDALFSNDILMIHGMFGIEMGLNKTQEIRIQFPAISNIVLMGTGRFTLTEINKPKNECKFNLVEQPDKEELNKYMKTIIATIFGQEFLKEADLSQFKFSSETRENYTMELSSGWLKNITSISTVHIGYQNEGMKKITKSVYVLK